MTPYALLVRIQKYSRMNEEKEIFYLIPYTNTVKQMSAVRCPVVVKNCTIEARSSEEALHFLLFQAPLGFARPETSHKISYYLLRVQFMSLVK